MLLGLCENVCIQKEALLHAHIQMGRKNYCSDILSFISVLPRK